MSDRRVGPSAVAVAQVAQQGPKWVGVFGVANAIVLGVLVAVAVLGGSSSTFMWVRGCVLLAVVPLLLVLLRGVARGSESAARRFRVVTTVMPIAIVGVDLVPGLCPWWYTGLQGVGALALIPVAVLLRRLERDSGGDRIKRA